MNLAEAVSRLIAQFKRMEIAEQDEAHADYMMQLLEFIRDNLPAD